MKSKQPWRFPESTWICQTSQRSKSSYPTSSKSPNPNLPVSPSRQKKKTWSGSWSLLKHEIRRRKQQQHRHHQLLQARPETRQLVRTSPNDWGDHHTLPKVPNGKLLTRGPATKKLIAIEAFIAVGSPITLEARDPAGTRVQWKTTITTPTTRPTPTTIYNRRTQRLSKRQFSKKNQKWTKRQF